MRKLTKVLAKNKSKIVKGGLLLVGTTIATLLATSVAEEVTKPDYEEFEDDIYEAREETIIDMEDLVEEED